MKDLGKLQDELKSLKVKRNEVELKGIESVKALFIKELKDILNEDEIIVGRIESVEIQRQREGYNYPTTIVDIRFKMEYDHLKSEAVGLELSCSSKRAETDRDYEELVLIGGVAKKMKERRDPIVTAYNKFYKANQKLIFTQYEKEGAIAKQIKELEAEVTATSQSEFIKEFQVGVHFKSEQAHLLPDVKVKRKQIIHAVSAVKVLDLTKSGKSGTVEIAYKVGKKNETTKFEKVRISNLEGLFNHETLAKA